MVSRYYLCNQWFKAADILMLMDFIGNYYCNKLSDSSKQEICMKSFLILGFTSSQTKAVFEMIDGLFNVHSDFVGFIPFNRTTLYSRICTKIFFGINVNHSSTGGSCAWNFAVTYTSLSFGFTIIFPFHFRTDEFHGWNLAF